MATRNARRKVGNSNAPATRPQKAPSGEAPVREMGAEDESPEEARRATEKPGPAKQTRK